MKKKKEKKRKNEDIFIFIMELFFIILFSAFLYHGFCTDIWIHYGVEKVAVACHKMARKRPQMTLATAVSFI